MPVKSDDHRNQSSVIKTICIFVLILVCLAAVAGIFIVDSLRANRLESYIVQQDQFEKQIALLQLQLANLDPVKDAQQIEKLEQDILEISAIREQARRRLKGEPEPILFFK
jgi:predicted PurR-regulated permease PerM